MRHFLGVEELSARCLVMVSLLGGLLPSCGDSGSSDASAVAQCAQDLWLSPGFAAAPCPCTGSSRQPECRQSDCALRNLLWLREGGHGVRGSVMQSADAGTFSSAGVLIVPYSIDGGAISIGPPASLNGALQCDSSSLTTDNQLWERAPASMRHALERSWDGGTWLALSVDGGV